MPSWWPYDGPDDVLLSKADRDRWRDEGWWWPVVIAVLAVLVLLALWWLLAQFRAGPAGRGAGRQRRRRGRAAAGPGAGGRPGERGGTLDGVARAHVILTGRRSAPEARVRLLLEPHAAPGRGPARPDDEALAHARDSAGLAALPAEVRLRAAKHRAERVS